MGDAEDRRQRREVRFVLTRGAHYRVVDTKIREYRKLIVDFKGRLLKEDCEILMEGVKVLNDNRIAPLEERNELFAFKVVTGEEYKVRARVFYLYRPIVFERQEMRMEINSSEKSVVLH